MKIASIVADKVAAFAFPENADAPRLRRPYPGFAAPSAAADRARRLRARRDEFAWRFHRTLAAEAAVVRNYKMEREGGTIRQIRADLQFVDNGLAHCAADAARLDLAETKLDEAQALYADVLLPQIKKHKRSSAFSFAKFR
jgi:hypothetical protein